MLVLPLLTVFAIILLCTFLAVVSFPYINIAYAQDPPHATTLTLGTITNVPWGKDVTVTGKLTDNDASDAGVEGKTITFDGTGADDLPDDVVTNSDGTFTAIGKTSGTVATGWKVQAHFAGDSTHGASDSVVKSYSTLKHGVTLVLSTAPSNVPWGKPTSFTATLKDASLGGVAIEGKTIHFDGSGVIEVSDKTTDSAGKAIVTGTAPDTVATGWTYQAHFAGDSLYLKKDSILKTYSTTKHGTSITIAVSPTTVASDKTYKVYGALKDSTTGAVLSSKTITFTADSPITIADKTTDTAGKYSAAGLPAPDDAGTYNIQAHFAGDSLYKIRDSAIKTLTVTAAPPQGSLPSAESVFNTETFTVPHHVSHFILINPTHSHHDTSSSWISSTNGLYLPTDLMISQNTAVTLLAWDDHGMHQLQAKRADNAAIEWTTSGLAVKQYSSPPHTFSAATKYNIQDIYDAPGYNYDNSHIKGTITTQSSTVTPDGTIVGAIYVPQNFDRSMITSKGLTIESEYNFHKVWKHLPYDNTLVIYSSKQSLTNTLADLQALIDEIGYD